MINLINIFTGIDYAVELFILKNDFQAYDDIKSLNDSYSAKLIYLNFRPLEFVSGYSDPKHVAENYSYCLI